MKIRKHWQFQQILNFRHSLSWCGCIISMKHYILIVAALLSLLSLFSSATRADTKDNECENISELDLVEEKEKSIIMSKPDSKKQKTTNGASGARGGLFGAGGRFKGGTDPIMEKFNESISFDKR